MLSFYHDERTRRWLPFVQFQQVMHPPLTDEVGLGARNVLASRDQIYTVSTWRDIAVAFSVRPCRKLTVQLSGTREADSYENPMVMIEQRAQGMGIKLVLFQMDGDDRSATVSVHCQNLPL
jgi:hypothetical protein